MVLAQIGFFTTAMESLATAVGAGMLLGGFGAGSMGLARGWSRQRLERKALTVSYGSGIGALILIAIDLVIRYGG